MEIRIHHSQILDFLQEIENSNHSFEEFASKEQQVIMECEYIKTERNQFGEQYNIYELELVVLAGYEYKYVALLSDGLVTVNPEHKDSFKEFGEDLLQQTFVCDKCGRTVFKQVFICQHIPTGVYKYFGGKCIDIVYPQYKYITQVYRRYSEFLKKYSFNESEGSGGTSTGYGRFIWFHDTLLVFNYLYPKFKINPEYNIKNDSDLWWDADYFGKNKLPEFTDDMKNEYPKMIDHYIKADIPTDNDFMFNLYRTAQSHFRNKNYVIPNNLCAWIVAVYLRNLFKVPENIDLSMFKNPYVVGDKIQKVRVELLSRRDYEDYWGHRTQLKTEFIFKPIDNEYIRFTFSTTKELIYTSGDILELSGTIKYISGKTVKFNQLTKWKLSEPEVIEEL